MAFAGHPFQSTARRPSFFSRTSPSARKLHDSSAMESVAARPPNAVVLADPAGPTEGGGMAMYWKEITVNWGESDPFGLVYYPRIVAWFNDTEHELFRVIGYPIEQMIKNDRTTFVMGEIHFRFIGPAAYGDRIVNTITLAEVGARTL